MQTNGSVYKEIFEFYNVKKLSVQEKQTARKYIREHLRKEFPDYDWSDISNWNKLSVVDRNHFKLTTMRNYFTEKSLTGEDEIKQKIDAEMKDKLIDARKRLQEHNEYARTMFVRFYDENASDEENHKMYEEFCTLLPRYTLSSMTPTYEQFVKGPHRLYDYYQTEVSEFYEQEPDYDEQFFPPVTTADVDHIALRAIIAHLEKALKIKVDFDGIRDCLEWTNGCIYDNTDTLSEDEDSIKLFAAKKRLEDLDFIVKL